MLYDDVSWRKSRFSTSMDCVEVAKLPDGRVAVRNSNRREAGTLILGSDVINDWLTRCKAGQFDDLVGLC